VSFLEKLKKNSDMRNILDSADHGVSSRCEIPPTVAVKPNNFNSRPVVESLASQLQRQKISAEGASGYSKFKSDFQRVLSEETNVSPIPRPSEFQQKRKQQFASKKALFEATPGKSYNFLAKISKFLTEISMFM